MWGGALVFASVAEGGERPAEPQAAEAVARAPGRRVAVDFSPLRHRDFRLLWLGKGVSFFGSQITLVAVPFQVYSLTRSALAVGLIALCQLGPILALSLWGGALADALDKRRILIYTDVVLAALTALLAANAMLDRPVLYPIYGVAALSAAVYSFGRPALDSAIPRLVPRDQLAAASALNGVLMTGGGIVGPALGGVLIAGAGVAGAYALDTVTFLLAVVAGLCLRPIPPVQEAPRPSLRSIGEGLRYIRTQPPLIGTYAIDLVAMVFGMPDALLPALAVERFGGGARILGLLAAAPPLGALLASVLSGWTAGVRRHGLAIVLAVTGWGASITVFGLADALWLALLAAVGAGFSDMVSGIFRMTMWNQIPPAHLRGRLAGVEMASYTSGPALGNFEAGLVASLTSLRFSIVSGGVLVLIGAAAVSVALPGFLGYRADERT